MNKIDSVLESWKNNKDVEQLIANDVFSDPNAIRSYLDGLSAGDRDGASVTLTEIQRALEIYISNTASEKHDLKEQIDNALKSTQACASYGSASGLGKKPRDKT
jgi:hypothetical protein